MQPLIASFVIFCSKYKCAEKIDVQNMENQMLNFGLIDKVKGGIISESFPSIQKVCQITKGQINSKGLFGILGFFQKMNEQSRF